MISQMWPWGDFILMADDNKDTVSVPHGRYFSEMWFPVHFGTDTCIRVTAEIPFLAPWHTKLEMLLCF